MQVGTVQQGIEYADELPKLHKEIKRDVSWVGAVSAQADMTIRKACYLTKVVKASKRCASRLPLCVAATERRLCMRRLCSHCPCARSACSMGTYMQLTAHLCLVLQHACKSAVMQDTTAGCVGDIPRLWALNPDLFCCRDADVADAIQADADGPWWARAWWHFDVFIRPWLLRGVAVAAAALSAVLLWCEVAVGISTELSPLSHLVAAFNNQFVAQVLRPTSLAATTQCASR